MIRQKGLSTTPDSPYNFLKAKLERIKQIPSNLLYLITNIKNIYKSKKQPAYKAKFSQALVKNYQACKEENITHNEEINQSTETNPKLTKMLKLADKDTKVLL